MTDLSLAYLCVGGEPPPPTCSPFSQWAYKGAVKELPLVGQLSLPPHVDNVYPFLLLNGFSKPQKKPQVSSPSPDAMNFQRDDVRIDDEDSHADDHDSVGALNGVVELPLLWQHPSLQHHHHPHPNSLDGSIWSHLPNDLMETIAAFLHVPDAVRLCIVSKQWNSFPYSPHFLRTFHQANVCGSSVLMFQCVSSKKRQTPWLALYDTVDNRWYSMDLSFLPAPPVVPFMNYTVVAASGGLLCLWPEPQKTCESVGFIVCNPVTRSWKELPCRSLDNRLPDFVAMYVDSSRSSYKILAVTAESMTGSQLGLMTELYDSESCKWKVTGTELWFGGQFKSMAVSAGKIFFVCAEQQCFKFKVFDMEEQRWRSSFSTPAVFYQTPEDLGDPELLDCNGRLLLVGRVGKHFCKEEVVIWELESSVNNIGSWREVDRMPQDIAREFLGCLVFGHYHCISRGDQIFFIASFKAPMLTYDVLKRAWSWWAWPFYEKYANRFPKFGFVKNPPTFPPFGFAFDLHFGVLA